MKGKTKGENRENKMRKRKAKTKCESGMHSVRFPHFEFCFRFSFSPFVFPMSCWGEYTCSR